MALTDLSIRKLPIPERGQTIHLDDQVTGFGVRVSQGGTKTFVLTYGKERKRITLGRYPLISLANAREEARRKLAEATLSGHTSSPGLQTVVERFLKDVEQRARPRTHHGYKRLLDRHLTLTKPVADITPRDLSKIFDDLDETPQERSHLIAVVKMLFRYAQRHGYSPHNPAIGYVVHPPKPRSRVLTDDELHALWNVLPDDAFGNAVKLMLLTGQRRGEIQHIIVDGDVGILRPEHTKNHRHHAFPIGPLAQQFLAKPHSFNGWGKAKARLDKQLTIPAWTLHDLRRTFATVHAHIRTPVHIIERLLNHVSGSISGVAATYNRYSYMDEMRYAVKTYETHLATIIAPKGTS